LLTGFLPAPTNNWRSQKKPIHLHSKLKQEPMIGNALIVTIAILLALGFWLMGELKFLIPYRQVLIHQYARVILLSFGVLFVNLFALLYVIQRKFFLKDTGRKLSHIDKQAITGDSSIPVPKLPEEAD
jgi:hypothetical protein